MIVHFDTRTWRGGGETQAERGGLTEMKRESKEIGETETAGIRRTEYQKQGSYTNCCGLNECVEALTPNMIGFEDGGLQEVIR